MQLMKPSERSDILSCAKDINTVNTASMCFQQIILLRQNVSTDLGHFQSVINIKSGNERLHSMCYINEISSLH